MASVNFLSKLIERLRSRRERRDVGAEGESLAARHLIRSGYRILDRNWRCRIGELDIVAMQGDTCVFVVVKSSARLSWVAPEQRVHFRKQGKLQSLAASYLRRKRLDLPCRFDVIAVWWQDGQPHIRHIENAF